MISRVEQGAKILLKLLAQKRKSHMHWKARILEKNTWGRMVVAYSFYRNAPSNKDKPVLVLVGKFYPDNMGEHSFQVMQELNTLFSRMPISPILNIPRAYMYDSEIRLLVQEYVAGKPYKEIVPSRYFRKYFKLVGKALAFLHAQKLVKGELKSLDNHLTELIHPAPDIFSKQLPQYEKVVPELIKEMRKQEKVWKNKVVLSPIHRDFHLRQLYYKKGHVCLIDWDLFAKGNPALDVGNFVVYLRTHLPEKKMIAIDSFLEGYFDDAPSVILERVFLYESFTYLRLACKCLWLKGRGWKERAHKMIGLSESCLLEGSYPWKG